MGGGGVEGTGGLDSNAGNFRRPEPGSQILEETAGHFFATTTLEAQRDKI